MPSSGGFSRPGRRLEAAHGIVASSAASIAAVAGTMVPKKTYDPHKGCNRYDPKNPSKEIEKHNDL